MIAHLIKISKRQDKKDECIFPRANTLVVLLC